MDVQATAASLASGNLSPAPTDQLREVDVNDFLKLLITELQNQDPLNPTDNNQILEQVGQIRSIQTTSQLSETLQSVLLGQNMSSAAGLIDRQIEGLTDDGQAVTGRVERVSIVEGVPKLLVGEKTVDLKNVKEILKS